MDENITVISESGTETPDANADYVAAIKELREKTVSKEAYEDLRKKNKDLLSALVNGDKIEENKPTEINVDALREKLFGKGSENLSNLEYVKTALDLRTELIKRGERDPFLAIGSKVADTAEMHEKAQRVADAFQDCIDYADGDSALFTSRLQRITVDPPFIRRR